MNYRRIGWLLGSQLLLIGGMAVQSNTPGEFLQWKNLVGLFLAEGSWLVAWGTYSFKEEPLGKP